MKHELFHLAADGCNVQVILKLVFEENHGEGLAFANVVTCVCTKSDEDVDNILSALGAHHASDANHLGWHSDHVRLFLGLPKGTEMKSKHLISYLCKKYNFKLNF